MSDVILQVSNLEKQFRVGQGKILRAVDNVSFTIQRGKTLGLVGESGCGKTTVGRTLLRIYEPDGGSIVFDGQDISKVTRAQAKAPVSYTHLDVYKRQACTPCARILWSR